MPIYEYSCQACGELFETIQFGVATEPRCPFCGAVETRKVLSVSSSVSGAPQRGMPGPKDHGCCGQTPGASGCTPGSCCGRA